MVNEEVNETVEPKEQESVITMKQLLEAGVHFGHQSSQWNPKMKEYIYGARNGIHIIDLQKTLKSFLTAYDFVRDLASTGKDILFVGTKKQAQQIIGEEAIRSNMPFVNSISPCLIVIHDLTVTTDVFHKVRTPWIVFVFYRNGQHLSILQLRHIPCYILVHVNYFNVHVCRLKTC